MKIVTLRADQSDGELRGRLRSLTLRDIGVMSKVLGRVTSCPEAAKLSHIIMLQDDSAKILGWGLWHNNRIMVYVRHALRRQGLASVILKTAKKKFQPKESLIVYNLKLANSADKFVYVPFSMDNREGWALWSGEDL